MKIIKENNQSRITYVAGHAHLGSVLAVWEDETGELELDFSSTLFAPNEVKSADFGAVALDEIYIGSCNCIVRNCALVDDEAGVRDLHRNADFPEKSVPDSCLL